MTAKSTSCHGWKADSAQAPSFSIATLEIEGGGRVGVCSLPGLRNRLEDDLEAVLSWRPDLVLSLTEKSEMEATGSWGLGKTLAKNAVDWVHLPVRDFGGLEGQNKAAWPALSGSLQSILDAGKAVLVQCRGGQGRSGMIALRLLVERGEDPSAALERLRSARPGAVETETQLAWAQMVGF